MTNTKDTFQLDLTKLSNFYQEQIDLRKTMTVISEALYKVNKRYKKIQNKYNLNRRNFEQLSIESRYVMRESWEYFLVESIKEDVISLHMYYPEDTYNDASDWTILVGLSENKQDELYKLFEATCKSIKDKTSNSDKDKILTEINKLEVELKLKKEKLHILKTEAS